MAELINRALLIYQEAGRLSKNYVELSQGEHGPDKRLLRAVAGYLVQVRNDAAGIVCRALINPEISQEAAGPYLEGLERETGILSRLIESRKRNQEESEAG